MEEKKKLFTEPDFETIRYADQDIITYSIMTDPKHEGEIEIETDFDFDDFFG